MTNFKVDEVRLREDSEGETEGIKWEGSKAIEDRQDILNHGRLFPKTLVHRWVASIIDPALHENHIRPLPAQVSPLLLVKITAFLWQHVSTFQLLVKIKSVI